MKKGLKDEKQGQYMLCLELQAIRFERSNA